MKTCPICGKPMEEEPGFKGYWRCPDYKTPLNDTAPFQYKCTGSELTDEGAEAFDKALGEAWLRQMKDKAPLN